MKSHSHTAESDRSQSIARSALIRLFSFHYSDIYKCFGKSSIRWILLMIHLVTRLSQTTDSRGHRSLRRWDGRISLSSWRFIDGEIDVKTRSSRRHRHGSWWLINPGSTMFDRTLSHPLNHRQFPDTRVFSVLPGSSIQFSYKSIKTRSQLKNRLHIHAVSCCNQSEIGETDATSELLKWEEWNETRIENFV